MGKDLEFWQGVLDVFLKESNCYEKYHELKGNADKEFKDGFIEYIVKNKDFFDIINWSFRWDDDVFSFWHDLCMEWEEFYHHSKFIVNTKLARKMYPNNTVYKNYIMVKK